MIFISSVNLYKLNRLHINLLFRSKHSMVQYADIKNGVDFSIVEGFLTFICYGSEYEYNNQIHLITTGIQIKPYNDNRAFIHLNYLQHH